jgi:hypothetical protein
MMSISLLSTFPVLNNHTFTFAVKKLMVSDPNLTELYYRTDTHYGMFRFCISYDQSYASYSDGCQYVERESTDKKGRCACTYRRAEFSESWISVQIVNVDSGHRILHVTTSCTLLYCCSAITSSCQADVGFGEVTVFGRKGLGHCTGFNATRVFAITAMCMFNHAEARVS